MTFVRVLDAGLQTSVQDAGRIGWEHLGIPRGGALDFAAYRWANRLAGNPEDVAVLESLLLGLILRPSDDVWMGVTGAGEVHVGEKSYPPWSGFRAPAGAVVRVSGLSGARCYIAVHGGIDVEPVLGSRSTNVSSGFGGFCGRALQIGDDLPVGPGRGELLPAGHVLRVPDRSSRVGLVIRVVGGPRQDRLPPDALPALLGGTFTVSNHSDAMGIRLEGMRIPADGGSMLSEPMPVGGIQITPSGQPIILMNGRGTIGGYPVLATVVTPDVWRLGQARPLDQVRFRAVSHESATALTVQALARLAVAEPVRGDWALEAGSD